MASELPYPDRVSEIPADAASQGQLARKADEEDPLSWYGLVWRIVRPAMESDASLARLCILIVLAGAALWLIASVGK